MSTEVRPHFLDVAKTTPWHPFLTAPLWPLHMVDSAEAPLHSMSRPMVAQWIMAVVIMAALSPFLGARRAGYVATWVMIGPWMLSWLPPYPALLLVLGFAVAIALVLRNEAATPLLNGLSGAALAAGLVGGWLSWPSTVTFEPFDIPPTADRADLYVLVLDGHPRGDVLSERFGVPDYASTVLGKRGFAVAPRAHSNYLQTLFSMASLLHADFVDAIGTTPGGPQSRPELAAHIPASPVIRTLKTLGYETHFWPGGYTPFGLSVDVDHTPWFLDTLTGAPMLRRSVPGALADLLWFGEGGLGSRVRYAYIFWAIDRLEPPGADAPPTAHFVHVLAPHPSFVVASDGTQRTTIEPMIYDHAHWHTHHPGGDYRRAFADQTEGIWPRLGALLDRILATERGRLATILVVSDHGSGLDLDMVDPSPVSEHDRASILWAVRTGEHTSEPPDEMQLVNSFPWLFNQLFDTNLPEHPQRILRQSWEAPFELQDITDAVLRMDPPAGP